MPQRTRHPQVFIYVGVLGVLVTSSPRFGVESALLFQTRSVGIVTRNSFNSKKKKCSTEDLHDAWRSRRALEVGRLFMWFHVNCEFASSFFISLEVPGVTRKKNEPYLEKYRRVDRWVLRPQAVIDISVDVNIICVVW